MTTAQSNLMAVAKIAPLAAAVTVFFGYALAVLLARRQEIGKQRAAAEQAMRQSVRSMRQNLRAAALHYAESGIRAEPELVVPSVAHFTLAVVDAAWNFPRGQQVVIRSVLVALVGEVRVRMAEEFGPNLGPPEHPLGEPMRLMDERLRRVRESKLAGGGDRDPLEDWDEPEVLAAFAAQSWAMEYSNETGGDLFGLFGPLEHNYLRVHARTASEPPEIQDIVTPVLVELDKLLALSGGSRQLGVRM